MLAELLGDRALRSFAMYTRECFSVHGSPLCDRDILVVFIRSGSTTEGCYSTLKCYARATNISRVLQTDH